MVGHRGNVKCALFTGPQDQFIASGASDNEVRLWETATGRHLGILRGHNAKVWDLCTDRTRTMLVSASGDRTAKLWDIREPTTPACAATFTGHGEDVYSVAYHPGSLHVVTGGYDKTVRIFDVTTETMMKSFAGHDLSVAQVTFNPLGNLVISGSKDKSIKFWDILSGTCIKTFAAHLGEVTSVAMSTDGSYLLSSSKDNSTRLWDIRMMQPVQKFKGYQNISKHFIRSGFLRNRLVISGSEDGILYLWDQDSGEVVQRLEGHEGTVYSGVWSDQLDLLCSCSDDGTVRTWRPDPAPTEGSAATY